MRLGLAHVLVAGALCACARTGLQAEAATVREGEPASRVQALVQQISKQLVHMPGGRFEMGDWGNEQGLPYDGDEHSRPLHAVTLDAFSMMAYKVTYEEFDLFTDAKGLPRINQGPAEARHRQPRKPAGVNWYGAKAFCTWLREVSGLPFDLPTEAQWEYAARSGGRRLLFATDDGTIDKDRNYPWSTPDRRTPDIGSYPPNPSGLYGMLDLNASEWVNDWYAKDYYQRSPQLNPQGPETGQPLNPERGERDPAKVIRGHVWPGNSPTIGGFVFSRSARNPRYFTLGSQQPEPGFSGHRSTQFRCAVQGPAARPS